MCKPENDPLNLARNFSNRPILRELHLCELMEADVGCPVIMLKDGFLGWVGSKEQAYFSAMDDRECDIKDELHHSRRQIIYSPAPTAFHDNAKAGNSPKGLSLLSG